MYGIYAQFLLGVVQLIIAFSLLFFNSVHSEIIKLHLRRYWVLALATIASILILSKLKLMQSEILMIIITFIFPMFIATYFVYITYMIQKK